MNKKSSNNHVLKRLITGFLAIVLISTMFLMVGCGGRDDELVGRWAFEDDPAWITTFEEDGTGTHTISWGYGTEFRWRTPGNNIRWSYPGHPDMDSPYRISDDALYITLDDGTTFRYIRN